MNEPNNNKSFGEEVELVQGFGLQPTNSFLNVDGDLIEAGEGPANNASVEEDEDPAENFIV
jgi:hypothetical protein